MHSPGVKDGNTGRRREKVSEKGVRSEYQKAVLSVFHRTKIWLEHLLSLLLNSSQLARPGMRALFLLGLVFVVSLFCKE